MRKLLVKDSNVHGKGLFAGENIPWGERIIRYLGQHISHAEASKREARYRRGDMNDLMELNSKTVIDGSVNGGLARFANHSRKNANCVLLREKGEIWIVAGVEGVKKGEELLYDYGSDYFPPRKKKKR